MRRAFSTMRSAAWQTAPPPMGMDHEPPVPWPLGTASVSPCTTRIFSKGRPRLSLTIWLKAVSCPWPLDMLPLNSVTPPSLSKTRRAVSWSPPPPPQRSMKFAMPMPRSLPRAAASARRASMLFQAVSARAASMTPAKSHES